MASPKTSLFTAEEVKLANLAKALSHPARISILRFLSEKKSCVCGTIVDAIPLSQATVSQHLRELRDAGLIQGEIDGPRVCYCIHAEGLEAAFRQLSEFTNSCRGGENCDCP